MAKEKVFIILSHKHRLKQGTRDQWEVEENVEFVNQVRNKHTSTASVIADYLNKKVLVGSRVGMAEYDSFDNYIRKKYQKQMRELDAAYGHLQKKEEKFEDQNVIVDQFGNVRTKTVFDV